MCAGIVDMPIWTGTPNARRAWTPKTATTARHAQAPASPSARRARVSRHCPSLSWGAPTANAIENFIGSADALAMSLWPSRGLELHGFEIKASRADWRTELRNPETADEIATRCDRWWIVAGSADIVTDGELPPTWGLLVPLGSALVAKV